MSTLPTIPLARARLAARAPKAAFFLACLAMTFGGLVRAVRPDFAEPAPAVAEHPRHDSVEMQGVAERFAAAYFELVPGDEENRYQRLTKLGLVDSGAPDDRAGRRRVLVTSTSVAGVRRVPRGADVTIAVAAGGAWQYLLVPVRQRAEGLFVAAPPAVVGPPPIARGQLGEPEDEVQSPRLRAVVARVVRHYIAGDRADLAADLAPGAAAPVPRTDLRVASIGATTWAVPGRRVAVLLQARGRSGLSLTLRYELDVARRGGRWFVTAVADHPNPEEQSK